MTHYISCFFTVLVLVLVTPALYLLGISTEFCSIAYHQLSSVHLQSHPLCFLFTTTHLHCPSTKQAHACRQPRRPQWTAWRAKALLPGSHIGLALTRKFQFRSVQLFKNWEGTKHTAASLSPPNPAPHSKVSSARHISPVFLVTIQRKLRSLFYSFMFPLQSISKKNNRI